MAGQMKPLGKLIIIILILGGLFVLYKVLSRTGVIDKIARSEKKTVTSGEVKKLTKGGTPMITVGINTWGGYAPGVYFNNGFSASNTSRYFTEEGILVEFKLIDDFKSLRDAWRANAINAMGLATVDSLPCEINDLAPENPKVFMQTDWSRGGDAIVAVYGINSTADVRGKKVAVAIGTPSHSLLLLWLQAGGVGYNEITPVGTDSGIQAAQNFKAGAVDVAVVWSPDDQDCIKAVPGAHLLFNTKKATNVIADVFVAKESYLSGNQDTVRKFMSGWFKAAAEINTNSQAKAEAAKIVSRSFNVDTNMASMMIDNARLSTYGDNMFFFGLAPGTGTQGEEVYTKMHRLFSSVGLAPVTIPPWRNITNTLALQSLNLVGKGHEAEGSMPFTAPTPSEASAPAIAQKSATVNFEFASAILSEDGKLAIDMFFSNTAREFAGARIRIEGNTDSIGSRDSNVKLSWRRANAVANYLVNKYGFDRNRFVIIGNGPDKPVADNNTDEGRAKNRRTDFALLE